MPRHTKLFTFDFVAICLLMFLTYCNITVFYNLYLYLQQIGIPQEWRGFLLGSSSLSTIAFFLFASPYLTIRNAAPCASLGAALLVGCGLAYLHAMDVPSLLALRLVHGVAIYLLSAASMTMLVSRMPSEHSGQAFSLYSVALLLPYSIVPAVCDHIVPLLPSPAYGYRDMSLLLLPGLLLLGVIGLRQKKNGGLQKAVVRISFGDMYRNAASPPIAMVLLLNTIYIVTFSSLFFMAKGLFQSRGYSNVGLYFTIQMCCMIVIRAFGNRIFDRVRKIQLIRFSFAMSAVSFVLAANSSTLTGLYASSLAMGIGMGVGSPSLYALMFHISPPRFKAIDSNLMMLSLQIGNFLGPLYGAWMMHVAGYGGFLLANAAACCLGVALCFVLTSRRVDVGDLAARA
jgi:MFS family permease